MHFDGDASELNRFDDVDFDPTPALPLIAHEDLMLPLLEEHETMVLTIRPTPVIAARRIAG